MKSTRKELGLALICATVTAASVAIAGPASAVSAATEARPGADDTTVIRGEIRADGTIVRTETKVPIPLVDMPLGSKPADPAPRTPPPVKLDHGLAAAVKNPAAAGRVQGAGHRDLPAGSQGTEVP